MVCIICFILEKKKDIYNTPIHTRASLKLLRTKQVLLSFQIYSNVLNEINCINFGYDVMT